jgi:hypothetical protein
LLREAITIVEGKIKIILVLLIGRSAQGFLLINHETH